MARGGSRGRRSYTRDARGRFASTGTTGRKAKPARTTFRQRQAVSLAKKRGQTGYLGSATRAAKARLKASRAKLTPGASRQQKAAVTRAQRMAAALAGQRRIKTAAPAGVIKGRVKRDPGAGARLAGKAGKESRPISSGRPSAGSVAGTRKRSAETQPAATQRKRARAESKLRSLYDKQQKLETSINRRRGRIEGAQRDAAKKELKKTKQSIEKVRAAIKSYDAPEPTPRTGKKAPSNQRTARNKLETLNRRIAYLRKNELLPFDKWGRRVFAGKLEQASKDRGAALAGISGQRFTYRSKRRATVEQRVRTNRVIDLSRKRHHDGQSGEDYLRYGIKTKRDTRKRKGSTIRATSHQGNLLSGRFERVRSGKFRPLSGRTWF